MRTECIITSLLRPALVVFSVVFLDILVGHMMYTSAMYPYVLTSWKLQSARIYVLRVDTGPVVRPTVQAPVLHGITRSGTTAATPTVPGTV